MEKIIIWPLSKIDPNFLEFLRKNISRIFGSETKIEQKTIDFEKTFDEGRKQYSGPKILAILRGLKIEPENKYLAIVDVDLYSPSLNFIFGLSDMISEIAIISLCRLRQEFYGLPSNENLFKERAIKEVVHEIGHLFFLNHCENPKCVMHFSNTLADTDEKEMKFCKECQQKLKITQV